MMQTSGFALLANALASLVLPGSSSILAASRTGPSSSDVAIEQLFEMCFVAAKAKLRAIRR